MLEAAHHRAATCQPIRLECQGLWQQQQQSPVVSWQEDRCSMCSQHNCKHT